MTTDEEIRRGQQAIQLLDNELFKEAFDRVEQGIITTWRNAPIRDIDGQHELKLMLKLLADVKHYVTDVANTGKLATIGSERAAKVKE